MRTIKWADENKKDIVIKETKTITRAVNLEGLLRDLEIAEQTVNNLKAEIAEIKNTLGIKENGFIKKKTNSTN